MKFKRTSWKSPGGKRACAGFTLAEVLAALVFMAIVIPVAIEGVRIANQAGQVGLRKVAAARVAERVLNEALVSGQWRQAAQTGTWAEGLQEYRWELRVEPWPEGTLRLMTVAVNYPVLGREYEVRLSTLVDPTQ